VDILRSGAVPPEAESFFVAFCISFNMTGLSEYNFFEGEGNFRLSGDFPLKGGWITHSSTMDDDPRIGICLGLALCFTNLYDFMQKFAPSAELW